MLECRSNRDQYYGKLKTYLSWRFPLDVLRRRVASRLKASAERSQTHYYVFSLAERDLNNPVIKATVEHLKQTYPSIVFIQLSNDPELYLNETETFEPIREHLGSATR